MTVRYPVQLSYEKSVRSCRLRFSADCITAIGVQPRRRLKAGPCCSPCSARPWSGCSTPSVSVGQNAPAFKVREAESVTPSLRLRRKDPFGSGGFFQALGFCYGRPPGRASHAPLPLPATVQLGTENQAHVPTRSSALQQSFLFTCEMGPVTVSHTHSNVTRLPRRLVIPPLDWRRLFPSI
jgi:hypothetical protein